jgi:4-amino-4-deoxy-L-arabinose transferase-like glycosyltransferase
MRRGTWSEIRWSRYIPVLIVAAPLLFFLIGLPFQQIASDAANYVDYARHIVTGQGYTSSDTVAFSNFREPGYPLFLAAVFGVFGLGNYVALYFIQSLMLGLLGLCVYGSFARIGWRRIGYAAGLLVSLLPSYGLYTHTVASELPFAFLAGLIFYLMVRIATDSAKASFGIYALIGLLCGYASLVRGQFLLFLPCMILFQAIFWRHAVKRMALKFVLASLLFLIPVGSWIAVVHSHTGGYAMTTGRPEMAVYIRAVRAQLSYSDLNRYAYLWFKRSVSGGQFNEFLYNNEYQKLNMVFATMAVTPEATAAIQKQDLAVIRSNLGHYFYDSLIEVVKTVYIEHDYSDVINKPVRTGMYLVVYGLFICGLLGFIRTARDKAASGPRILALLSALLIAYNIGVLSFFDAIPRYNTPYLTFYIVIGLAGIGLWSKRLKAKSKFWIYRV